MATFAIVRKWMNDALGPARLRDRFAVTTDPEKGDLLAIARQEKFPVFEIPHNVGGRFSVLTPVGTLPAALLGFDVEALMRGAAATADQSRKPFAENPALAGRLRSVDSRSPAQEVHSRPLPVFAGTLEIRILVQAALGRKPGQEVRPAEDAKSTAGRRPQPRLASPTSTRSCNSSSRGQTTNRFCSGRCGSSRTLFRIEHPYKTFDSMGYLEGRTVAELFEAERQATEMAITEAGRPNSTVYVDRIDEETRGQPDHVFPVHDGVRRRVL